MTVACDVVGLELFFVMTAPPTPDSTVATPATITAVKLLLITSRCVIGR